jgi:hypothetical protein
VHAAQQQVLCIIFNLQAKGQAPLTAYPDPLDEPQGVLGAQVRVLLSHAPVAAGGGRAGVKLGMGILL